ncbi:MAG: hypothetical protein QM775_28185 [Pirellulales bacterium]
MASLAKQLKRDLTANPKKAGMLGVLCLVCAWFWGPLVFPKDSNNAKTAKPTAATTTASSSTALHRLPSSPRRNSNGSSSPHASPEIIA